MSTNKVVGTSEILVTKDYQMFKKLLGNRDVTSKSGKLRVRRMAAKIEAEGNLMPEFPAELNHDNEVVDGQTRIAACEFLGYPVYYRYVDNATLQTVRQINLGRTNWSWHDFAESFAAEGNVHYKDLLDFEEAFHFSGRVLVIFTAGGTERMGGGFRNGEYKILDKGESFKLLNQLNDIRDCINIPITSTLARALHIMMQSPDYDHARMTKQLGKYADSQLKEWRRIKDFLRNLEDIYNLNYSETSRLRFF